MTQDCEMYFFIKVVKGKRPDASVFHTVIWDLGHQETTVQSTTGMGVMKKVEVDVSKSLGDGGQMTGQVYYDIFYFDDPNIPHTSQSCMAKLSDPKFTWKDDALAITLHCVRVSHTDEEITNPFCPKITA